MKQIEIACNIGTEPSRDEIVKIAAKALGVAPKAVGEHRIVRRSIDARTDILYRYRIDVCRAGEDLETYSLPKYNDVSSSKPVIVVGSGPAGMFAALKLLTRGFKPIVLERGKDIRNRKLDIVKLSREGEVNPESNYCFGEGGAGTYSDGKLYTRSSKRGDIREVLYQLVDMGADPSILIDAHPHIGSDKLPTVVENIRKCIIEHGGEYHFESKVEDIIKTESGYQATLSNGETYISEKLILATGHSARDIFKLFNDKGWQIEAKGIAIGVRVEHPQSMINKIQYHGKYQPYMPTAEYSFVTQIEGRGVFSFCMCPGGVLVPAATGPGELVLNGMSNSARSSKWANSGVVVSVEPDDIPEYAHHGPLAMLEFQKDIEKKMFEFSGSLKAPAQRLMDFCRRIPSTNLPASSYVLGVINAPLYELLPEFISIRLKYAFPEISNKKIRRYYTNDALVLGVESRTSSPVRIPRDSETLEHPDLPGLYPCGEGAGYAGGIVSSALDGINCAAKI